MMNMVSSGLVITTVAINGILIIAVPFMALYVWRSGKDLERLYIMVPILIVPVNGLFLVIDQQVATAVWLWPTALAVNLIAFLAIGLAAGYLWHTAKIARLMPHFFILLAMATVALSHMLFSLFYWWL